MTLNSFTPTIIRLDEAPSTNQTLRELLQTKALPNETVVLAEAQTKGRGQIGNTWEAAAGRNLTFSVVLYPTFLQANKQFLVSQICALSVKETLEAYTDHITVKWPNDIYWCDKKICGILIENDLSGKTICSSILGVGLNVNQQQFVSDAPNPISLAQITGTEHNKEQLLQRFCSLLHARYMQLMQGDITTIQSDYFNALYRRDGYHPYKDKNGLFDARIVAILGSGHLVLSLVDGKERTYAFKEVSIR